MSKLSLFLVSFVIIAFSFKQITLSETFSSNITLEDDSIFLQTCQQFDKIELPLTFDCKNSCCEHQNMTWNQITVMKQNLPEGLKFVGILRIEKYIAILGSYSADNVIPAIVTFDLTGKIIDEKVFYTGNCGKVDQNFESHQFLSINETLVIDYKDSSVFEKIETVNGQTEISTSVELKKEHYRINEFGIFVNN